MTSLDALLSHAPRYEVLPGQGHRARRCADWVPGAG